MEAAVVIFASFPSTHSGDHPRHEAKLCTGRYIPLGEVGGWGEGGGGEDALFMSVDG